MGFITQSTRCRGGLISGLRSQLRHASETDFFCETWSDKNTHMHYPQTCTQHMQQHLLSSHHTVPCEIYSRVCPTAKAEAHLTQRVSCDNRIYGFPLIQAGSRGCLCRRSCCSSHHTVPCEIYSRVCPTAEAHLTQRVSCDNLRLFPHPSRE